MLLCFIGIKSSAEEFVAEEFFVVMSSDSSSVLDVVELVAEVCLRVYFERSPFESNFLREASLEDPILTAFDARGEAEGEEDGDDFVVTFESNPILLFWMRLSGILLLVLIFLRFLTLEILVGFENLLLLFSAEEIFDVGLLPSPVTITSSFVSSVNWFVTT